MNKIRDLSNAAEYPGLPQRYVFAKHQEQQATKQWLSCSHCCGADTFLNVGNRW